MNEPLDPPDDEPDYTCPECGGSGTVDVGTGEAAVCQNCKGHGSMEERIASDELERQIQNEESKRDSSEGCEL